MILSNNVNTSIEVVLAGAVTTNQLKCVATWVDTPSSSFASGQTVTQTNNTTAVTLVPNVTDTFRREVTYLNVLNLDTVNATVSIHMNVSGAETQIIKVTLASGSHLIYTQSSGWQVFTSGGAVPETTYETYFVIPVYPAVLSPADSTTYYFGGAGIAPSTTDTNQDIIFGYNFTVVGAVIMVGGNTAAGTTEDNTIQLRNVTANTSSLIGTFKSNGSATVNITTTITGLNINVNASDSFCLRWDAPAYVTNPTGCGVRVNLICKRR